MGGVGGSWSKAGVGISTGDVAQEGQEAAVGSEKGSGLLFSDSAPHAGCQTGEVSNWKIVQHTSASGA